MVLFYYYFFLHSPEDKQKSILFKKNGDNPSIVSVQFLSTKKTTTDMIRKKKPEINNIGK